MSIVVAMLALGASSRALAFSNPSDYGKYPLGSDLSSLGGGAGRYYTGSPADGYSCENCHSATRPYSFPIVQTGLPLEGYVPGTEYKIELSSPQADIQLAQALATGSMKPASALTAEFIAQDGGPAGTITFANNSEVNFARFPGLFCSTLAMATPGKETDEYAMSIYRVDTGSRSTELTLTDAVFKPEKYEPCSVDHGKDEEGAEYERRCVVTMRTCGAKSVKFMWKAPEKWSGPIWFSMGYVATYDLSSQPNDEDYVTTMSVPLNPSYKGPTYETELNTGCSVVAGPRHSVAGSHNSYAARGPFAVAFWLVGWLLVRSRQRRGRLASSRRTASALPLWAAGMLLALACLGGTGCTNQGKGLITDVAAPIGAYESIGCVRDCTPPVVCRMCAWEDAGTPESLAEEQKAAAAKMMTMDVTGATGTAGALDPFGGGAAGAAGEAAPGMPATGPKSLGAVTAVFTTSQPEGVVSDYAHECPAFCQIHYVAAWIENDQNLYVRTLFMQKGKYVYSGLSDYFNMGNDCQYPPETVAMDAMASATIQLHELHTLTWDGLFGNGHRAAPPGAYHLKIMVAIDEMHPIPVSDVPFVFGDPAPFSMMIPPAPAHSGVTLTYTPNP